MQHIQSGLHNICFLYLGYNADIICLQEVDTKVFDSDLEPTFSSLGFQGIFSKKGGQVSEGVACLFNANKFELIETSSHVVATELPINPLLADLWQAVQNNEKLSSRVLDRTTSCHLVLLQSVHTGKRVVVANTHLYFHPDADHIRLLQAASGLRLAQDLHRRQVEQGFDVSLIFCGDFNSCPGYGVLEMMTLQTIDKDYPAWASSKFSFFLILKSNVCFIVFEQCRPRRSCKRTVSLQPNCHGYSMRYSALYKLYNRF